MTDSRRGTGLYAVLVTTAAAYAAEVAKVGGEGGAERLHREGRRWQPDWLSTDQITS